MVGANLAATCCGVTVNDEAWRTWLAETNRIMQQWDSARGKQLTRDESVTLVRRTAAALLAAAEQSKRVPVYKPAPVSSLGARNTRELSGYKLAGAA